MILLKDAAEALGLSQKALLKMIDEGTLSSSRLGSRLYLQRKEVDALLAEQGRPGLHEETGVDLPLSVMLREAGIHHDVPGTTRTEVLRNALSRIRGIDPDEMGPIFEAFLQRETLGSTSIGHGIALPHARDVLIGSLTRPLVSLAFTASPIDWETPDGIPVRAVFTLITPNGQTHLRILGHLSRLLHDPDCGSVITRQAPAEEILKVFRDAESRLGEVR